MASSLGAFQFDNLVQGRVPFLFVNLGVEIAPTYAHMYKMHLERCQLTLPEKQVPTATAEEIAAGIRAMNYPFVGAVVVVDGDGKKADAVTEFLESSGFTNAFFLRGGWDQLLKEKSEGF